MGYTTEFWGSIDIEPPLNQDEISYLNDFANTRRMNRANGPYYVKAGGYMGQDHEPDVRDYNNPPLGQPGLWCHWVPGHQGSSIVWSGAEKFYDSVEWMEYIINEFLSERGKATLDAKIAADERFKNFTFDHVLNGEIDAQGEEPDDRWRLRVENNKVHQKYASISFD